MNVLHIFSGDLWAGAEVVIFNLLSRFNQETGPRVLALSLNEGVLVERLRAAGITTHVIPEARHTFAGILYRSARLLKSVRVAAIHSHGYNAGVAPGEMARGE